MLIYLVLCTVVKTFVGKQLSCQISNSSKAHHENLKHIYIFMPNPKKIIEEKIISLDLKNL